MTAGRLPTFVVIGAQKTGTTSLWHYLCQHPDVAMAEEKEPNFFLGTDAWQRGVGWYRQLFAASGDARAVGEASTMYSMYPHAAGVPKRMKTLIPDARLVYVVREPIDRMVSLYGHHLAAGWERRPIGQALLQDARYADSSRYAMQLEQYLRHFEPQQLLVLASEALASDPQRTVQRAWEFLGVDATEPVDTAAASRRYNTRDDQRVPRSWWWATGEVLIRTHTAHLMPQVVLRHNRSRLVTRAVRPEERVLDEDLRARLADVLRPDLERLRPWMGPDFDGWGLLA